MGGTWCHFCNWHTPKKESTSILAHLLSQTVDTYISGTKPHYLPPHHHTPPQSCYDLRSSTTPHVTHSPTASPLVPPPGRSCRPSYGQRRRWHRKTVSVLPTSTLPWGCRTMPAPVSKVPKDEGKGLIKRHELSLQNIPGCCHWVVKGSHGGSGGNPPRYLD